MRHKDSSKSFGMAACFGLFRKKHSGSAKGKDASGKGKSTQETIKNLSLSRKKSEALKKAEDAKEETVQKSHGQADNFASMTELREKIMSFRDSVDLPPCVGSLTIIELVKDTVKELHKSHPDVVHCLSMSDSEGAPMHEVINEFCVAIKSLGNHWMHSEEWMVKSKKDDKPNGDLEKYALALLDDMVKVTRERMFDMMDVSDKEDMREGVDSPCTRSYSDKGSSGSPTTPTSVLPEFSNSNSGKMHPRVADEVAESVNQTSNEEEAKRDSEVAEGEERQSGVDEGKGEDGNSNGLVKVELLVPPSSLKSIVDAENVQLIPGAGSPSSSSVERLSISATVHSRPPRLLVSEANQSPPPQPSRELEASPPVSLPKASEDIPAPEMATSHTAAASATAPGDIPPSPPPLLSVGKSEATPMPPQPPPPPSMTTSNPTSLSPSPPPPPPLVSMGERDKAPPMPPPPPSMVTSNRTTSPPPLSDPLTTGNIATPLPPPMTSGNAMPVVPGFHPASPSRATPGNPPPPPPMASDNGMPVTLKSPPPPSLGAPGSIWPQPPPTASGNAMPVAPGSPPPPPAPAAPGSIPPPPPTTSGSTMPVAPGSPPPPPAPAASGSIPPPPPTTTSSNAMPVASGSSPPPASVASERSPPPAPIASSNGSVPSTPAPVQQDKGGSPPPPIISSNESVPSAPPPEQKAKGGAPPPPPPPIASSIGSVPSAPPPVQQGEGGAPPPPPPIASSTGSVPSAPPPVQQGKGGAPPPPPTGAGGRLLRKSVSKLKRSSQMACLYRQLQSKVEGSNSKGRSLEKKPSKVGTSGGNGKQGMADALAEMTKRSSYFQQIEEDVKNYASAIKEVKAALVSFQTTDMDELVKFHKYVESHLEKLTDETQVLARFEDFPSKKLEGLRMAAALYSKLDAIATTLKNWKIEPPVNRLLDQVESYFNKIKGEIDTLDRTKDDEIKKFKSQKIDFDFGILIRIRELMVDVSSGCMELALKEKIEAAASKTDGKKTLWKTFQFAFRVYSFAGGQDDRADNLTKELAQQIQKET